MKVLYFSRERKYISRPALPVGPVGPWPYHFFGSKLMIVGVVNIRPSPNSVGTLGCSVLNAARALLKALGFLVHLYYSDLQFVLDARSTRTRVIVSRSHAFSAYMPRGAMPHANNGRGFTSLF